MKRIYITGPYSANNVMDVLHNIRRGIDISTDIFIKGYSPWCPWLDFHFVLQDKNNMLTIDDFYRYSMDWLEVSDAMLVLPGYDNSRGTLAEIEKAKELNIPIFYNINEIK